MALQNPDQSDRNSGSHIDFPPTLELIRAQESVRNPNALTAEMSCQRVTCFLPQKFWS